MKQLFTIILICSVAIAIQGCKLFKKNFDKQVDACVEDVKIGLGDPGSLELLSSRGIDIANGMFRVELKYTAKNAMGGRVRGSSICGFKDKNTVELNAEDIMNQERQLARDMKELGL